MDWSKAKNIIIIALVAVNIFIGIKYYDAVTAAERDELEAQESIREYLSGLGVSIECEPGGYEKRLPVLFVSIATDDGEEVTPDGRRIVVTGAGGLRAVSPVPGDNKGSVISPYDGMLKLSCRLDENALKDLEITGAELVYLVDRAGLDAVGGRDTAVPAWEIVANGERYYVNALEQ